MYQNWCKGECHLESIKSSLGRWIPREGLVLASQGFSGVVILE